MSGLSEASPNAPVPPQNLDAEESVLGAMMLSPKAIDAVSEVLHGDDFYRASHGTIYRACLDLYGRGDPVDAITVCDELERAGMLEPIGGRTRINEIAALVPATSNAAHYASIVREMATLRRLGAAAMEIQTLVRERGGTGDELIERAEQVVFDVAQSRQVSDFAPVGDVVRATFDEIELLKAGGSEYTGITTGLLDFDRLTAGLQPGNLIVVAGRPSMGKSAFALGILAHVALRLDLPAALFTMEMSKREVVHRLISMEARIEANRIRTGRIPDDEWGRLVDVCGKLTTAKAFIDDAGAPTILEVRSKARRLKAHHPDLAVVIVDYLQLMTGEAENRVQEIGKISRALKVLAGELDVPVIALSQLSRQVESRHDKRPILSDLRESGSIEQDADLVVFLYRDEYYNPEELDQRGIAEAHLAKQRNGPTGTVKLHFHKRFAKFGDLHIPNPGGS